MYPREKPNKESIRKEQGAVKNLGVLSGKDERERENLKKKWKGEKALEGKTACDTRVTTPVTHG